MQLVHLLRVRRQGVRPGAVKVLVRQHGPNAQGHGCRVPQAHAVKVQDEAGVFGVVEGPAEEAAAEGVEEVGKFPAVRAFFSSHSV